MAWFSDELTMDDVQFAAALLQVLKASKAAKKLKDRKPDFVPGDAVCLVGLESFAQLNGKQGTLLSYDAERHRWQVDLKDGIGVKNVLLANLSKVRSKPLPKQKPQATPQRGVTEVEKRRFGQSKLEPGKARGTGGPLQGLLTRQFHHQH